VRPTGDQSPSALADAHADLIRFLDGKSTVTFRARPRGEDGSYSGEPMTTDVEFYLLTKLEHTVCRPEGVQACSDVLLVPALLRVLLLLRAIGGELANAKEAEAGSDEAESAAAAAAAAKEAAEEAAHFRSVCKRVGALVSTLVRHGSIQASEATSLPRHDTSRLHPGESRHVTHTSLHLHVTYRPLVVTDPTMDVRLFYGSTGLACGGTLAAAAPLPALPALPVGRGGIRGG